MVLRAHLRLKLLFEATQAVVTLEVESISIE